MQVLKESYQNQRIREIDKQEVVSFLSLVIPKDISLKNIPERNFPSELVTADIKKMILTKYSFLTPTEVELALEMERYGEFEEKSQHFQFYGTEYVAEILKKYCKWKQKKAIEHNLSRKPASHQIEHQIDEEKINQEYQETILSELREGKTYRSINAHLLLKSVPNQFKPTQNQYYSLLEKEENILQKEKEIKLTEQKDPLIAKKIIRNFNETLKLKAHQRVCNIIVCNWLYKTIIQNGT